MYKRALTCLLCAAAVLAGPVAVPGTGFAAEQQVVAAAALSPNQQVVLYMTKISPFSTVKTDAWVALTQDDPEAAAIEFLRPGGGFDNAMRRATQRDAENKRFLTRLKETHSVRYSPWVWKGADFYLTQSSTVRDKWIHGGGYDEAKRRDTADRAEDGAQKRALVEADRDYIRMLAQNDPGEQVRFSASYATRQGSTDDDLTDFFAWGWANGARLDIESFRQRLLENATRWQYTIHQLIKNAEDAEKAARELEGEAGKEARAKAAAAWREVNAGTAQPRSKWDEAAGFAGRQADLWHQILLAAQAQADNPNWRAIIDPATSSQAGWMANDDMSAEQAEYWKALLQKAIEGEQRVTDPS